MGFFLLGILMLSLVFSLFVFTYRWAFNDGYNKYHKEQLERDKRLMEE